jgi:hypothetical protein
MMGPYMGPIPALGSVAMLISLFAAFVFTPWLAISKWLRPTMHYLEKAEKREHKTAERLEGMFRSVLMPLIESPRKRLLFRVALWGSFALACSMFYTKWVAVKMLPLDNKPEFSVVLDMPEGTALPVTANLLHRMTEKIRTQPEVTALQVYAGTARPFDFNGMVRHYYLRSEPWQGEVQVQLLHKRDRKRSSHEIAVATREALQPLIKGTGAKIAVVEMPPGPPVLQSVVAEVHGPSAEVRRQVARELTDVFSRAESLVDVDNYMRDSYEYWRFSVDTEKAVRRGISVDSINRNLSMALGSATLGDVKQRAGHEPVNIVMQVPLAERSQVTRLGDLPIQAQSGMTVPLRELGEFQRVREDDIIYRKDLRDVEYVVADVGGRLAAPVYGMFQVQDALLAEGYQTPDGVGLEGFWLGPPKDDQVSAFEWTGEWTVTYETFRDMGAAFMVALVLIYILVVWEFGNFRIPALIMAPIPLTLLGIIPMHAIMGAEFTATSMIGWIALAGIIVRNSILLVDFSIHEVQRGVPVKEAVIRSCKTRTRPIMITALALVAGSSVIFTDPIFQGMAISLASGVMVSTILTLVVIPLGCIKAERALCQVAAAGCAPGVPLPEALQAIVDETGKAAAAAPVRKGRSFSDVLFTVWAKVASVLMMVFYAIRGIFLLLGQMLPKRSAKPAPAPAAQAAPPPPAAAAPTAPAQPAPPAAPAAPAAPQAAAIQPAATPGHPLVSSGAGVTKVISPAKATIVPAAPVATPPVQEAKPAPAPTTPAKEAPAPDAAKASPAAEKTVRFQPPKPKAPAAKKKAAPPAAPSKPAQEAKAAVSTTTATEARAKVSGRRGIRLKLIKPGENDSGLK